MTNFFRDRKRGQSSFWLDFLCGLGLADGWFPGRMAGMARIPRAKQAGRCFHVLNRGNARASVFHKNADFAAFVELMTMAQDIVPMRLLAWTLMPNHFHFVRG